jgi:hypothetical protein
VTLETLKAKVLTLGIPGLFVVSFLDSVGVPLPGGADVLVMLLSWQRPADLFLIAVVATLGSLLGSLVLYQIARTKGDAMMSRFPKDKQDRVKEKFRQNDILALLVAMLGPPPLPTKFFVLVAGVVRMDWRRFVAAVFAGRLIRFLGEAYLAVKVGDRAAEILKEHYPSIAGALTVAVVLFLLLRRFVQRGPRNEEARAAPLVQGIGTREQMTVPPSGEKDVLQLAHEPSWRATLGAWLFGLLLLAAVVGVVVHFSEIEELGRVVRRLRPAWLVAGLALQSLTYVIAARIWQIALAQEGHRCSLRVLVPTAFAMLFANQALPSAGLSGSAVVVRALRRRYVPANVVMGALVVGLVTTYTAYLIAVLISVVLLRRYHAVSATVLLVTGIFALAAAGVPAAIIWFREDIPPKWQARLTNIPGVGPLFAAIGAIPTDDLRDRSLLVHAGALQFIEIVLDAATLQIMLIAIGAVVAPTAVFGSFVMAAAVSRVVPVPLGLGTFEGALVALLHVVGVSLEAALTATMLLRGFTLWLPMLPGLWFARRDLWPNKR